MFSRKSKVLIKKSVHLIIVIFNSRPILISDTAFISAEAIKTDFPQIHEEVFFSDIVVM